MSRKLLFMRRRIEVDLEELFKDPMEHKERVTRTFIGANMGVHCAFLCFIERPMVGPFAHQEIEISIVIKDNYPYEPPQIYSHSQGFPHPNKDPVSNRMMFSFVDPKYWKPIFELKQVVCGLEMILIIPEILYTSLRSMEGFSGRLQLFKQVKDDREERMDAERPDCPDYSQLIEFSEFDQKRKLKSKGMVCARESNDRSHCDLSGGPPDSSLLERDGDEPRLSKLFVKRKFAPPNGSMMDEEKAYCQLIFN